MKKLQETDSHAAPLEKYSETADGDSARVKAAPDYPCTSLCRV